jgi:hypothetical protein
MDTDIFREWPENATPKQKHRGVNLNFVHNYER